MNFKKVVLLAVAPMIFMGTNAFSETYDLASGQQAEVTVLATVQELTFVQIPSSISINPHSESTYTARRDYSGISGC